MSPEPGQKKTFESIISICLLAILFLIGFGVFLKQSNFDMSRFGINTTRQSSSQIAREKDLSSFVPAGFKVFSKTEIYDPKSLYEKINGKAPLYTESGFVKLFTQRFVNKGDETLWAELFVYDMATSKNAFSVYSTQKRPAAEPFPGLEFAYKTSNALYFCKANYYIELVGSSESTKLSKPMTEIAQEIHNKLATDKNAEITELELFPADNFIAESTKLYLTSTFGFKELADTFTAQYKFANDTITAFISKKSDRQQAKLTAESYYNFLITNGGTAKPAINKNLKVKVIDFYGTTEIVFSIGQFVAGIHEAEDQQLGENLAIKLMKKLSTAEMKSND